MNMESLLTIDNLKTSPADIIKKLAGMKGNDLYRAVLGVQNDLNAGENIHYLSGQAKWLSAKNVLDLGCGPGDLIVHLRRVFADKFYAGVDRNRSFIKAAREQTNMLTNCVFYRGNLYKFGRGRYDFVILRAVLQHLKNPGRFMKHLPELLQEGAAVLFLDTTKENFVEADPPITAFNDFYDRLEAIQKRHTGSRDCMAELEGQLAKYQFKLIESRDEKITITDAENRAKVVRYLILACAISKKLMSASIELKDLFADLIRWHDAEKPRLSLKGRLMLIERA